MKPRSRSGLGSKCTEWMDINLATRKGEGSGGRSVYSAMLNK